VASLSFPGLTQTGFPADAIERAQQACLDAQVVVAQSVALRNERERWRALWQAFSTTPEYLLVCCAYCGRVRSLDGVWVVDAYHLSKGKCVQMSHGVCDECLATHFPPWAIAP
jgi:hypothetical protein